MKQKICLLTILKLLNKYKNVNLKPYLQKEIS